MHLVNEVKSNYIITVFTWKRDIRTLILRVQMEEVGDDITIL